MRHQVTWCASEEAKDNKAALRAWAASDPRLSYAAPSHLSMGDDKRLAQGTRSPADGTALVVVTEDAYVNWCLSPKMPDLELEDFHMRCTSLREWAHHPNITAPCLAGVASACRSRPSTPSAATPSSGQYHRPSVIGSDQMTRCCIQTPADQ
jgi:hypothetical protein